MDFQLRVMTPSDIPAGMRLKELAGWNQTRGDWERFLAASPEGCFVAESGGQVLGSAATITYENRFAWIGMVLVDPAARGQGMGTKLLEKTIEYLDARRVPCMKLDATPQGKPIYAKLGFQTEYEIERWALKRPPSASAHEFTATAELTAALRLDREVFGADRSELLGSVAREAPEFALLMRVGSRLAGYAFGRRGSRADHLGPWVAESEDAAVHMLDQFLSRATQGLIFVDALDDSPWAMPLLRARGFESARPLTRMFRGGNDCPGRPEVQGAILGPEFG